MATGNARNPTERPTLAGTLSADGPLDAPAALALIEAVTRQAAACHANGRLHLDIDAAHIRMTANGPALDEPAAESVTLGRGVSDDLCPPELRDTPRVKVPASIGAARDTLTAAGIAFDPKRIDVYRLGVLLCRVLTGDIVAAYLRSPQTAARVPSDVRPVINAALGLRADNRCATCDDLLAAIACVGDGTGQGHTATDAACGVNDVAVAGPTSDEPPFTHLGPYRIDARIGHGGMGDVYRGFDAALDRVVAIKVLPDELARQPDFVARFHAEARAVAKLVHPNVVQIYAIGEDAGRYFFAMQYVPGESMTQLLERRTRLTTDEALPLLTQAVEGLAAAHDQGLIHRDIKPGNLLVDDTGRVLISDFGLVKAAQAESAITVTGVVMGTVDYIAPEQARGERVDTRADLYALGVLMYRVLAGRLPFNADTPTAMIFLHAYEAPPPIERFVPDLPDAWRRVIDRLMQKAPDDRYPSARALLADLHALRDGRVPTFGRDGSGAAHVASTPAHGRRAPLMIAMILIVGLAVVIALSLQHRADTSDAPPDPTAVQLAATAPDDDPEVVTRLIGHAAPVTLVDYSDNARWAVSGDSANTLRVWDLSSASPVSSRPLVGHAGKIFDACVSDDGERVVSAGDDGSIRVWDVASGASRILPEQATDVPGRLALSATGDVVAIGELRRITARDLRDDTTPLRVDESVYAVSLTGDGRFAASGGWDKVVHLYDVKTGERLAELSSLHEHVYAISIAPNGDTVAAADAKGDLCVWDVRTPDAPTLVNRFNLYARVWRLRLSRDAKRLLVRSGERGMIVYDVASGRTLFNRDDVTTLPGLSPDGRFVLIPDGNNVDVVRVPDGR
ncbi:MAG: protein kinase [Phycisphaera sp.]|nr:protein kinase [Phycisphaera sp.]